MRSPLYGKALLAVCLSRTSKPTTSFAGFDCKGKDDSAKKTKIMLRTNLKRHWYYWSSRKREILVIVRKKPKQISHWHERITLTSYFSLSSSFGGILYCNCPLSSQNFLKWSARERECVRAILFRYYYLRTPSVPKKKNPRKYAIVFDCAIFFNTR